MQLLMTAAATSVCAGFEPVNTSVHPKLYHYAMGTNNYCYFIMN